MFSERLENLIEAALQDGVLTDQEKASIVKRAQAEGEDIDEVEIYIKSLMQKHQQEQNQKKKEANAIQAKEDQEFEKERSEKLRKCPKCGTLIPHLTNVCPECGFVIDSNETDKRITALISILRDCISNLGFYEYAGRIQTKGYRDVKKSHYENFQNCYIISGPSDSGDDFVKVDYNLEGVLTEASLYEENETIKQLIVEFRQKGKKLLLDGINTISKKTKYRLDNITIGVPRRVGDYFEAMQGSLDSLKNQYSDLMSADEITEVEGRISNLKKICDEIINSSEYKKKVKQSEGLELFGGISGRLFWAIVLLFITFSCLIIIIL